ncbi:MAG: TolB-like 6-bladed beta-propeller domain-containing protein [Tannerella sp.]|jgi:hypothetical protein|nr:TolB-like 6-bladed beta-propeller domain-containing protein [Tannerella sp.]
MKNIFVIYASFFLLSCTNTNHINRKIVFEEEKMLVAEQIRVNEIFSPDFVTKKENCFIIASNRSDTMLYVYSLPSLTCWNRTGTKGQGPEEIQFFPMFCESPGSKYLYVWGYTPLTIKKFKIGDKGKFVTVGEYQLSQYEAFNCMHVIDDSLFVYYLPDELTVKKYNLKTDEYLDEIKWEKEDHAESYYYSNRGLIAVNKSNIVYSYIFKKQIDIYDLHTGQKKAVITDGKKYPKPNVGSRDNLTCYVNIYAGTDRFYALSRKNGYDTSDNQDEYLLEVFDYDGNPIVRYTFDIAPFLFAIDEDNEQIYGYSSQFEDYLLRYKMSDNCVPVIK